MSESVKTLFFVVLASGLALGAYLSQPEPVGVTPEEELKKPLFAEFIDPLQAASMSITAFEEDENSLENLIVSNSKNGWVIQSKGGYPADAQEQMTKAANGLIGLEVLSIAADSSAQHAEYGVVEPSEEAIAESGSGLGQLVTIKDESNASIASIIIGKSDNDNPNLRYVRVPNRDRVYVVNLDPTIYSTKFEDWIENDLLRINPFDVQSIQFKDYLLQTQQLAPGQMTFAYLPRMDATLLFQEDQNNWQLVSLLEAEKNKLVETKLKAGEAIDTEKLNEVRNGLDQLTLVDAVRKPQGLAENLKLTGNFAETDLAALVNNGFYPVKLPGQEESSLNGNNGELIVETKDSVRYRLLFGKEVPTGDDEGTFNRYLFVRVELNQDQLQKPELKPVPEVKEGDGVDLEKLAKERELIISENKQLEDAYQEKRNTALSKVYELNSRFADWYYIISDEQFKKIFLKRDQIASVPKATTPAGGQGPLRPGFPGGFPGGLPGGLPPGLVPGPGAPPTGTSPKSPTESEKPDTEKPKEDQQNEKSPMNSQEPKESEKPATPAEEETSEAVENADSQDQPKEEAADKKSIEEDPDSKQLELEESEIDPAADQ